MPSRHVHVEPVMGTVVSLDARGAGARAAAAAFARLTAWLHDVDARFSPFRAGSEICRIDRGELPVDAASADVQWALARCEALRRETGGAFDARAGGRLDPSALVKGWAVQRGADLLGLERFSLNCGGDVVVRGGPWRIGIQHPLDRSALAMVLEVSDLAVATSGAYERGGHVLDPRTGAASEGLLSVTVVGPDLGLADAYSTAAFALGLDGPRWTLGLPPGYEAMSILAGEAVLFTPGFPDPEERQQCQPQMSSPGLAAPRP